MHKSLALTPLLFLGAVGQQLWVAIRITTTSSLVLDDCVSYFTTTVTPPISYFTITTALVQSTRTDDFIDETTASTTTSETSVATISSITTTTQLNTAIATETTTETSTLTTTSTVFATEFTTLARRQAVNERGISTVPNTSLEPQYAPVYHRSDSADSSTRLCAGARTITVTAPAPSSTTTVSLDLTSSTTVTSTQTETDTVTELVSVYITTPLTSTVDETSTTTFTETSTTDTTTTTVSTSTSTTVVPQSTGVFRARGGTFDGQYGYNSNELFPGVSFLVFGAQRADATTIIRTTEGHLQLPNTMIFGRAGPSPNLSPFFFVRDGASGGFVYIDAVVGPDGVLAFSRGGSPGIVVSCGSTEANIAQTVPDGCTEFSIVYEAL
ncbi:uncharacterized protein B0I36DRAFT_366839 [Microdochium trichocladiopsis]|uniref:Uncharacterized protein n=1 Tax=Microdochium trichocladiopsis TaxID=1682393 RepID=A0A9P9BJ65_9PEZI|nr:uncharacterized protein B0I36DRAFT_366839 [Microdochium trichocladiopsis]KAH7024938.1 hypothetical protein B0I36DRAFT_366839 [Microdochium trichocladiopsis]